MKIAICDDDFRDIKYLGKIIQSHSKDHEIIEFLSAKVLLERIYGDEHFDLLFLDVQMPDADGWKIARELKQARRKIFIVMVTIHGEYIFDCFDRVDWFAPKPIPPKMVFKILNSAQESLFPRIFEFQTDKLMIPLTAPEIIYFEVNRNTLFIHTTGGCRQTRLSLKKVQDMLNDCPLFVQPHRSFIINLDHYDYIKNWYIVLKNGEQIKLSRTYRDSFYAALSEYVRGGR